MFGFFVTRLALFIVSLAVSFGFDREWGRRRDRSTSAERTKEITTTECQLAIRSHFVFLQVSAAARSGEQSERFRFDVDEQTSNCCYALVKFRLFKPLEISKKATDPRGKVFLKEPFLRVGCRGKASAGHTSHYFAKDGGVIFRFVLLFGPDDSERAQIVAQPRQRAFVQKAGEIVGAVGQQFASADTDEQFEKLAPKEFGVGFLRSLRQGRVRGSELRRIAANSGQRLEQR